MASENNDDQSGDLAVKEAPPKLKKPKMYRVIMLNDDYTPMEFVVHVLESFFSMDRQMATKVMLEVHTKGKGICGIFPYDLAETKASQVIEYARQNEHPLVCTVETEE
ncbi:MAG: ATP-dependent Clp protease adapter ClpS [Pseudomonadota bacterium]|nr:ATP-dependent Clp protease adapter ClpS [Pseudomonadota bacterium]